MQMLCESIDCAVQAPQLHIDVYLASTDVSTACEHLVRHGFAAQALPFLLHATLAMEAHIGVRAPRYLPWRCHLVTMVCGAYDAGHQAEQAAAFVDHTQAGVSQLEATFLLDPVPQPAESQRQVADAKHYLSLLRLKYELLCKTAAECTAALSKVPNAHERLCVLTAALSCPGRRTLQREAAPLHLSGVLSALKLELLPLLRTLHDELQEQQQRSIGNADGQGKSDSRMDSASNVSRGAVDAGDRATPLSADFAAAASVIPGELHTQALALAFTYQDQQLFDQLADTATLRVSKQGDLAYSTATGATDMQSAASSLQHTAAVLRASARLAAAQQAQQDVATALKGLAAALSAMTCALCQAAHNQSEPGGLQSPMEEMLEDAALQLWRAAQPLADGAVSMRDKEASLVATVLASVHSALQATGNDDVPLRCDPPPLKASAPVATASVLV